MAAERAQRECGCAAQVFGFSQAAGHQYVAAHPRSGERPDRQCPPHGDRDRLPLRDGDPVEGDRHRRTGDADATTVGEPQGRTTACALQTCCALRVPEDAVAEPEGQVVHRAGRWDADMPVADAARPVLHRGQHPWTEHFNTRAHDDVITTPR